jgi:hypothetical protein
MSSRTLRIAAVLAVVVLVAAGAWVVFLDGSTKRRYGDTPGIGLVFDGKPGVNLCARVIAIIPPARFSLDGRIWQEEAMPWADWEIVAITSDGRRVLAAPHEGLVTVGDRLCGLPSPGRLEWRYLPDDKIKGVQSIPER